MRKLKQVVPGLMLAFLAAGCATTKITNLTPPQQVRNANGFYPVEAAFNSDQQALQWQSIRPNVVIGTDFYPMRLTQLMTNRWETLVPIPEGTDGVYYRIKFDYSCSTFNQPKGDSKLSPIYRLQVISQ